jgi:hypothetical protein
MRYSKGRLLVCYLNVVGVKEYIERKEVCVSPPACFNHRPVEQIFIAPDIYVMPLETSSRLYFIIPDNR